MNGKDAFDDTRGPDADLQGPAPESLAEDLDDEELEEDDDPDYVPSWRRPQPREDQEDEADDLDAVDELDEAGDPEDEIWFREWWAHLPDFIKPGYPLDIPPARLPFVKAVFTLMGAPRHCAEPACRRARACQGGDGPPCYRADRDALAQVLFLAWAKLFIDLPDEEIEASLAARGSRYRLPKSPERRDETC